MPKAQEIDVLNPYITNRIQSIIDKRQNGKCRKCGNILVAADGIVSSGYHRNYYHSDCARKLHII
jgi:hypothetical protein